MAQPMPSPSQPDMMGLLDALLKGPSQPKYPPGYEKPDKPVKGDIMAMAKVAKADSQPLLDQYADTYKRLRYHISGYLTESDRLARELGGQTPWISSALVDSWNRFVAYLASRPIAWSVDEYDPEKQGDAQKIEDFCYYTRKKVERSWVERGNMALTQAEAKDLTLFGVLIARITVDLANTHCPLDFVLVDPASVFPVWGRAGAVKTLEAVYRITKMPVQRVLSDYYSNKPPKKVLDALGDQKKQFGESADVEVVEYWDTWWRAVYVQGTDVEIVPLTEHKYGCVPYVIQYGPGGEPMHTRNPDESWSQYSTYENANNHERTNKAVGYIERMKLPHDQREGIATRVLDATLRDLNPPMNVETTADGADEYEFPEVDLSPGATNHFRAGQERAAPALPQGSMGNAAGLLMTIAGTDAQTNLQGEGFSNAADKSNISGTARASFAEEGRESQQGWVEALELFRGRCAGHAVKLWRNWGHLARYGTGTKQPLYIPRRNPGYDEPRSYELTEDVVDNVDCEVRCTMNGLTLQQTLVLWDEHTMAEKAGVTDIQRVRANNRTARNIRKAEELPEFAKLITVPQALIQAAANAITEEEKTALMEQLQIWMQMVAQPQAMQMQSMGMPPQAGPGGMPPGAQPLGGIPGGTNTAAAQGAPPGPGSGPQGPTGNPSPPPPGSIAIAPPQ
jgi:hypothetical protein